MHIHRFTLPILLLACLIPAHAQETKNPFELKKGERVAWVGSSSVNIGVWPKTMEFLLRTRHPELELSFKKFSTGGGTYATGLQKLDGWLDDFRPNVVFLQYGSNDAGAGEKGILGMKDNIAKCVAKIEATKARVLFSTFQGADVRKSGELPTARRKLYAETLLAFCKEKSWPIVDVYHPIDRLQVLGQKDDDKYTILRDTIHLTEPAYIAWGYYLYDGMKLQEGASEFACDCVKVKPLAEVGCKVSDLIQVKPGDIRFTRIDYVLPYLPPGKLPPSKHVPLEKHSAYRLRLVGLLEGDYDLFCDGKRLGSASDKELNAGLNLNGLVLRNDVVAPWAPLAKQIWDGKTPEGAFTGKTRWDWRVVRK